MRCGGHECRYAGVWSAVALCLVYAPKGELFSNLNPCPHGNTTSWGRRPLGRGSGCGGWQVMVVWGPLATPAAKRL